MIWKPLLAAQSRRPDGLIGRMFMGPYLDRANRRINSLVYDELSTRAGQRILEIGFGGGELLFRLAADLGAGRIDGVELSPTMIAAAARRARRLRGAVRVELHRGGVEALPFADASFDRACSVHTVYFWSSLEDGLREISRVLKPGGRLVLGFSSAEALHDEGWAERGFKLYTPDQITAAARDLGFETTELAQRKTPGEFCH